MSSLKAASMAAFRHYYAPMSPTKEVVTHSFNNYSEMKVKNLSLLNIKLDSRVTARQIVTV